MVPFAAYSMPVQYPAGLLAEHLHTRSSASLFDVSHMGQIAVSGEGAAQALEALMPIDVQSLLPGKQRYGLLLGDAGGILDDLMLTRRDSDYLLIVNGACKATDLTHIQQQIGANCTIDYLAEQALLALQGPQAVTALQRLVPGIEKLVFMTGGVYTWQATSLFITRSGYTGEDGFEISVPAAQAADLAQALLAQAEVKPAGLGARNSLRLEAGLCLYGSDMDSRTTPAEAALTWAIPKVRRTGGARAGGFLGADIVLPQLDGSKPCSLVRVGLVAQARIPVREPATLQTEGGEPLGHITSGLLSPCLDQAIALGYVPPAYAAAGTLVYALVREADPRISTFERNLNMAFHYTADHEWLLIEGDTATVGITHHAQDALGDVVFVELPDVGKVFEIKEVAAVVESVKAAADVYMPLSGEIVEVNSALAADPSLANTDPQGKGWFFRVKLANTTELAGLLDEAAYKTLLAQRIIF
ncbi:unnamed protein product, partial [Darwinula stevensoni]